MAMQKFHDEPGSPAWLQRRQRSFNASDAPAMLGCSTNKTRTALLHELHTSVQREFSDYVQERVINPGHRVEALCRPIAAEILDEFDLEVVGGALEVPGLSRPLGASLDARTFLGDTNWECKSLNDELRSNLPHEGRDSAEQNDGTKLHKMYRVQMEQQMLVSGAIRTLFSAAAFGQDGNVLEERHCWYYPDEALRAEILAGWKQFDVDLAAYEPEAPKAPPPVAEPVEALPAVVLSVSGSIAVTDNFDEFETRARHFFVHKLIREPKTDQDFVNLDEQIKEMKRAEEALDRAETQMLAQVEAVYTRKQRKDMLLKLVRDNRLLSEKLLTSEKERRRAEIVMEAAAKLRGHGEGINKRLGGNYLPALTADFAGAIKGKRSLANMEDAVATLLASAKIAANEAADRIQANLAALRERQELGFLFPDVLVLVHKATDDLRAIITARIAEHEAKERARLEAERERIAAEERAKAEAAAEADRERIRAEEQAKVEAAARADQERQRAAEEAERRQRATAAEQVAAVQAQQRQATLDKMLNPAPTAGGVVTVDLAPAPELQPVATGTPAANEPPAAVDTGARMTLGQINTRIAPLSISVAGLASLGFQHAGKDKAAFLFRASDFPLICEAIAKRALLVRADYLGDAARAA